MFRCARPAGEAAEQFCPKSGKCFGFFFCASLFRGVGEKEIPFVDLRGKEGELRSKKDFDGGFRIFFIIINGA